MKPLCILGNADSWKRAPFDSDCEIWILNTKLYEQVPRFDRQFDVHIPYKNYQKALPEYLEFLKRNQDKLWIMDKSEDFPNANIIEWQNLFKKHGRQYFTSSFSWILAFAIEQGYTNIKLYGIELSLKQEYSEQLPALNYFIGYARGKGVDVWIYPAANSNLTKVFPLYGVD